MLNVFEITRMTNHNGPGIRTLVHFKGCPLRCIWCLTPESQSTARELGLNRTRCIGCGVCASICKPGALSVADDNKITLDRSLCTLCFDCVSECCTKSLRGIGASWQADDLADELLRDLPFFRSKGGITYSGGEIFLQPVEDLVQVSSRIKRAGVSIGVDTCGHAPYEKIESLLPFVDFFFWDIKHMDAAEHERLTGQSNQLILENLKKVDARGVKSYIRFLLVPGATDSEENIRATCTFVSELENYVELHLLPLHHLGRMRYQIVGRDYPLDEMPIHTKEELEQKLEIVLEMGVNAKLIK